MSLSKEIFKTKSPKALNLKNNYLINRLGEYPNCFLKHLLKYNGSLKPTLSATSETLFVFNFNNCAAFLRRTVLINSFGDKSVNCLILRYNFDELIPNSAHIKLAVSSVSLMFFQSNL